MKKALAIGLALVVAGLAGYLGYDRWSYGQVLTNIRPHVQLASVHATTVLDFEAGKGAPSYIEYFRRSAVALDELDKAVVSIRTHASPRAQAAVDGAVEYVQMLQGSIRELARSRRTMLAAQVAQRDAKAATDEAENADDYSRDTSVRRATAAIAAARAAWDAVDQSGVKGDEALLALERQADWARQTFGVEAVISSHLLNAVKKQRKK